MEGEPTGGGAPWRGNPVERQWGCTLPPPTPRWRFGEGPAGKSTVAVAGFPGSLLSPGGGEGAPVGVAQPPHRAPCHPVYSPSSCAMVGFSHLEEGEATGGGLGRQRRAGRACWPDLPTWVTAGPHLSSSVLKFLTEGGDVGTQGPRTTSLASLPFAPSSPHPPPTWLRV